MLILSGILGLLQSLLLPGLLLRKIWKPRGGLSEQIIQLLPLSLTASYLLVFVLSALRLYTRPVMIGIIAAECIALLLLYRESWKRPVGETLRSISDSLRAELRPLADFLQETPDSTSALLRKWVWAVSGCMALSAVTWAVHLIRLNFGTVFSGWDTLFSWNMYAESWAGNKVPRIGGMYPQLVPSNWSISYVLQGENAVQFFNTLLPPLFFLLILWMLFDLGFQRRECGFFFAAIICRYMMKKLMGDQLFDGYMDVPAAAMVLLSLYTLIRAEGREPDEQRKAIYLSVIFASAAAVTKQSGFVAPVLIPLGIIFLLPEGARSLSRPDKLRLGAIAAVIILPWYLHCLLGTPPATGREIIAQGIVDFNQQYDIHHRLNLAMETLGRYKFVFLSALVLLPFVQKRYRLLLSLMVWPLTIIWMVSYSYDARNLAVVLPIVSILSGLGLAGLGGLLGRVLERIRADRLPFILAAAALAALLAVLLVKLYPDEKLIEAQTEQQKALFGERLNQELLYGVFGETHDGNDIYTDYPAWFLSGYAECCSAADLTDSGQVRILLEGDKINYMLLPVVMPNHTDPAKALIEQCIADGKCQKLRCSDGYYKEYCLYEIVR